MKPIAKVGVGCLLILVTCVGGLGIFAYRVSQAKVNPTIDYAGQIEALVLAAQKPDATKTNRWSDLLAVLQDASDANSALWHTHAAVIQGDPKKTELDPTVVRGGVSSGDLAREQMAVTELVAEMKSKGLFSRARTLGGGGHFVRPLPKGTPLIELALIDLPMSRNFARAAAAQMRVTNLAGDYQAYTEAFAGVCAVGQAYMNQGIMIDGLTGLAIVELALAELVESNIAKQLPGPVLKECAAIIDTTLAAPQASVCFNTERLAIKDSIQWTFSDSGNGDGWLVTNSRLAPLYGFAPGSDVLGPLAGMVHLGRKATTEKLDEHFDGLVKFAKTPRPARTLLAFQPDAEVENLSAQLWFLKVSLPALGNATNGYDQTAMKLDGIRQLLATEIYMRDHGNVPPTVADELVPKYLSELPTDLICGKRFGYLVLPPGQDPFGRRYLIYSIGTDGIDHQGKEWAITAGRIKAVHPNNSAAGFDFVINDPGEALKKAAAAVERSQSK